MAAQITSMTNPQVKQVTALVRKSRTRTEQGLFVVEGMKLFREMPAGWLQQVYVSETFAGGGAIQEVEQMCRPVVVSDQVFTRMSDTCTPQGILALVKQPGYDLRTLAGRADRPFFLFLENLQDPGNVGTILRTAEAAGCTAVVMSRDTVDVYNPKVIRSTMGAIYRVPFLYVDRPEQTVVWFRRQGMAVFAAHLQGAVDYACPDYRQPCVCMIGNEGNGLTPALSSLADQRIRIPMEGKAESLNAAVSAALVMYEVYRQRRRNS